MDASGPDINSDSAPSMAENAGWEKKVVLRICSYGVLRTRIMYGVCATSKPLSGPTQV